MSDVLGWTDEGLARMRRERGWQEPAIERLDLTYDVDTGAIGIPIRDQTGDDLGTLRYRPGSTNGPKVQQPAGVPRQLFPPPESIGQAATAVLLTEGEADAIAAWSAGYAAVGVPGTGGWRPEYAARFSGRRWTVYVIFDCDRPGRGAALAVCSSLIGAGVDARLIDLDETRNDGFDLTDFLLIPEAGRSALDQLLDEAVPYTPAPAPQELEERLEQERPWRSQPWPQFRDQSPEEHRWLIEGLMPAGTLAFVAGPPKKGKTWVGLAISLAIATAHPLFGDHTVPELRPVLYVALEGSATGLRARIGALARGLGLNPDSGDLDQLHMLYRPRPFNLADLPTAGWLADEAELVDAGLVVVDVLRAAARFQENAAEDFARVRDALEPLLAAGRTVLLLHHFGKLTETQKERSPGERMAGTGAMYGALDVGLLITRSDNGARSMRLDIEARDFAAPDALGIAIRGEGSGEHGGFTYADAAAIEPDATAAGEPDYIVQLLELFDDGKWRIADEMAAAPDRTPLGGLGVNRKTLEAAIATETARAAELGDRPRIIRWDSDGREVGRGATARPFGSLAMYDAARSEADRADRATSYQGTLDSSVPPYGGDRVTELPDGALPAPDRADRPDPEEAS